MRCPMKGVLGLVGGLMVVSILAAQVPAPNPAEVPPPQAGSRGGFRGAPPSGDASGQGPTTPARGRGAAPFFGGSAPSAATAPQRSTPDLSAQGGAGLLRPFAALPDSSAVGKPIMLEVLIAETAEPLTQPTASDVLDLERKGKLKGNARVRLLSLENLPAFAQFGELASRVQGRTITQFGATAQYSSVNVGTIVQATSRLEADGTVLIQIHVAKSTIAPSLVPPEQREPENITSLTAQSTVRVKPGEPAILSAGPSYGPDASSRTWVVLVCNLL